MSRVVRADPARTVHLGGVGDVSRPVEVGRDVSGLTRLSMRAYDFLAEQVIDGEAEGDEVAIVLLRGRAALEVGGGAERGGFDLEGRSSPFGAAPHALYLPPHHRYRLTPRSDATVVYARAAAAGGRSPRHLPPDPARRRTDDDGVRIATVLAAGDAEHLRCDEITIPAGGARSLPAAQREDDGSPLEVILHVHLPADAGALRVRVAGRSGEREHALADRDSFAFTGAPVELRAPPSGAASVLRIAAPREG